MCKDDFKYLSQEFDSNVVDLVKQKRFLEKFEERLPMKGKFYSSLTGKKIVIKSMNIPLKFGMDMKWKKWNIIVTCT